MKACSGLGTKEDPIQCNVPLTTENLRKFATKAVLRSLALVKDVYIKASLNHEAPRVFRIRASGHFCEPEVMKFTWEKMSELDPDGFVKKLNDENIEIELERIE